ncbi:hypothetical protein BDQ12DRAFT_772822 [Crucibulum laeve]|uniref:Serine aminopeptidase S33 domain-containing protein n=1 Tax=Crucibulum laeve TaxID=68775 RepID=A0A5C3M541_9AGAR|nr:hypothetical protein BDQ12DRAFT_772822 [Crucibulum laeve]
MSSNISVRSFTDPDKFEETSLHAAMETRCNSLLTSFVPTWWLPNGHLKTIYNVVGKLLRTDRLNIQSKKETGLDFTPSDLSRTMDDAPSIVVAHVLTGGFYKLFLRAVVALACKLIGDGGLGYLGYRGNSISDRCIGASVPITSPRFYIADHTDDLRQTLIYIAKKDPRSPLFGLGFSLGAKVMTRYIEKI